MKYCTHCGTTLEDPVNYCSACGKPQVVIAPKVVSNPAALTTLCVLTILGSVLGIIRGLFYESLASPGGDFYMFGFLSAIANIGTLTGAILMLNRKMSGYIVYMICQVIAIGIILFRSIQFSSTNDMGDGFMGSLTVFLAATFIIPSIVFMVLYTTMVKKHLV